MLTPFAATATTCEVSPGKEQPGPNGTVSIRNQGFTDIVKSADPRIAGVNRPVLDIDLNPTDGTGSLEGRFTLQPESAVGSWTGQMSGRIRNGLVTAWGLARGTGKFAGAVMRVDFRQVEMPAGPKPCANPTAFFEMEGSILEDQ